MKGKAVSVIMLTLLSISMLTLAFNIQPVRASGTIYIRPDGSVEGTDKIHRDGDIYTFTDNIYDGIVVEKDNIVVDGAGYTLQGTGSGTGIDLGLARLNVTIKNTEIKSFGCGILLVVSYYCSISGNQITSNGGSGIWLDCAWNNAISGNQITHNGGDGINIYSSSCSISENNITNNGGDGIDIYYGYCNISGNLITNNGAGIQLYSATYSTISGNSITNNGAGIRVDDSGCNSISGNQITSNGVGISLYQTAFIDICGNNITNNGWGIMFAVSANTIYHNNFINNTNQVYAWWWTSTWDDGYPSGGNYWSDHIKVDDYSGVNQDELGSDGIVDEPYVIDANNRDNYPLVKPCGVTHDIGITGITPSETSVEPGSMLDINITVMNYGFYNENFNLTAYANTTIISQTEVTLSSRNSATITFTWNTTGVTPGTYTLKAQASTVPGETDTTDNTLIDGQVDINIHDIAVLQVTVAPTSVNVGETVHINVTVANQGSATETFNVTTYYNTSSIEMKTNILLDAGESITLEFSWNTTGVNEGTYIISVYATPVPNEINRSDNYFEDGMVTIVTPEYLTQKLIETIKTWNIPEGIENSLTSKLQEAILLLNKGNENGAIHKLMDFINQVEALTEEKLTIEQANYLISEAQRIIDLIEE